MSPAEILGFVAAAMTTSAFLPQTLTMIKTGRTQGLSILTYVIYTSGMGMWLTYGVSTATWPLVISSSLTIILATTILTLLLKAHFEARRKQDKATLLSK